MTVASGEPWLPTLALHTESCGPEPRLSSGDWRQDAEYPAPLWATTAADLARRVSIENNHSLYALELFGRDLSERCTQLFELAHWSQLRRYRISQFEAIDPIAEGFIRRLRLWVTRDAPEQPLTPPALAHAFFFAEKARIENMERWLEAHYGETAPDSRLFDWIDYPVFDNGTMGLGFAVLVHGPEIQLWSRAYHSHK